MEMEMTDSVNALASVPSLAPSAGSTAGQQGQSDAKAAASSPNAAAVQAQAAASKSSEEAVRLVIEPVSGGTGYTYKLFDRATGALLVELPREDAKKMSEDPGYSAGQVYSTKA
jgi:hypothetical protein